MKWRQANGEEIDIYLMSQEHLDNAAALVDRFITKTRLSIEEHEKALKELGKSYKELIQKREGLRREQQSRFKGPRQLTLDISIPKRERHVRINLQALLNEEAETK